MTVKCGGDTYAVHKCIVCSRSFFFARAYGNGFRESLTNTITLHDEHPALVRQMFEYLYKLDYKADVSPPRPEDAFAAQQQYFTVAETNNSRDKEISTSPQKDSAEGHELQSQPPGAPETFGNITRPLIFHILMYSLADRMMINGLKDLARENVKKELLDNFRPRVFPSAVLAVYRTTPESDRGLRDLFVIFAILNLESVRFRHHPADSMLSYTFLKSVPQFTLDLLVATLDNEAVIRYLPGSVYAMYNYEEL
ncbi:uncharacterized protein N7459_006911 [Penicillium hispanicum]|uniref:uncharacterized protein n=1 Tax=Penicillium hispanicum TaxID=1080232 RepID=UPI0025422F20|nr:uncharacterized protein N7459_006911 [Penicillium hispanicum]KAJ5577947.1 hypothetical protein N7459_006911 [Penicillium hispanicum]